MLSYHSQKTVATAKILPLTPAHIRLIRDHRFGAGSDGIFYDAFPTENDVPPVICAIISCWLVDVLWFFSILPGEFLHTVSDNELKIPLVTQSG